VAILAADDDVKGRHASRAARTGAGIVVWTLGPLAVPEEAARQLYAGLRAVDMAGVDVILARTHGRRGLGPAVRDRLVRAAEGRVVEVTAGAERRAAEQAADVAIHAAMHAGARA
jgi:L-threonylcarbamoyladenylate synthase